MTGLLARLRAAWLRMRLGSDVLRVQEQTAGRPPSNRPAGEEEGRDATQ